MSENGQTDNAGYSMQMFIYHNKKDGRTEGRKQSLD